MRSIPKPTLLALLLCAGAAACQERVRVDALGDPLPDGAVARLGSIRLRPGMWVTHLAFSPDGKQLASWSEAGFSLWDTATGRELRRVDRMETRALDFRWLKDGRGLAVLHLVESGVHVWDFTDPKANLPPYPRTTADRLRLRAIEINERRGPLALSPDGKYFAVSRLGLQKNARAIDVFEPAPSRPLEELKRIRTLGFQPGDCVALAFTPDSQSLLVFSQESDAKEEWLVVYDSKTGEERKRLKVPATWTGPSARGGGQAMNGVHFPDFPKPIAIAPDNRTIAIGPTDGAVSLWDIALGKQKEHSPTPNLKGCHAVAYAENGRTLVTAGAQSPVRVWDIASGRIRCEFGCEPGWMTAITVSPDGRRVAVGGYAGGIRIWDVATGTDSCPQPGHHGPLWRVAADPNGRIAATTGEENTLRLWDLTSGRELQRVEIDDYNLEGPHFTPDGKAVLAGGKTGLRLWDVQTGQPRPAPGALAKDTGLPRGFSADGQTFLTSAEGTIDLWDWPSGKLRREIVPPNTQGKPPETVSFQGASLSSDGRWVATIRYHVDGENGPFLEVWEASTGRPLHRPHRTGAIGLSWALFVPESCWVLQLDFLEFPSSLRAGKRLETKPLRGFTLWDAAKLQRRPDFVAPERDLHRHWKPIILAAFSPDGRMLATTLDGRSATLFEVATGQVRGQFPAGHRGDITSLAFTADGQRLISASRDQTALVWDVRLAAGAKEGGSAADAWNVLADMKSQAAYRAMAFLAHDSEKAIILLRERLKPARQPDDATLDRLVADLDSQSFAVRNRATAELDRLGYAVVPGVLTRWEQVKSLELRRRLGQFLDKYDRGVPPPEALRQQRAVEVLEHLATPAARALLRDLAGGAPAVRLTQDAAAALRRLERRVQ
jgi:WD40 repeat protein